MFYSLHHSSEFRRVWIKSHVLCRSRSGFWGRGQMWRRAVVWGPLLLKNSEATERCSNADPAMLARLQQTAERLFGFDVEGGHRGAGTGTLMWARTEGDGVLALQESSLKPASNVKHLSTKIKTRSSCEVARRETSDWIKGFLWFPLI